VSWWPGETDGRDLTGTNPATLQGNVTLVPAMVGQGFHFDGTNSYLQVADSPGLKPPGGFTIDAWVKFDSLNSDYPAVLVSNYNFQTGTAGYKLYESDYGFRFHLASTSGIVADLSSTTTITPGVFYHVAATWNWSETTGTAKLYVNGNLEDSWTTVVPPSYDTRPLLLGASGDEGFPWWFAGTLDEVEFYGRALSREEIASIYMAGGAGKCTAPYSPDLALTKEATLNSNLTYTITVTNNSVQAATGVTVTDWLPAGVSFVSASASPSGTCTETTGTVTCILGTLVGGAAPATITLVTQPTVSGEVVNTATVTLNEPDPDTSNNTATVKTTVPPVISSISPTAALAGGGGFTLTVNGANYMPGSVVRWNGADRTTAYVSAAQLTATIAAGDIAVAGAVPVTVFTPMGGESYSIVFTVIQSAQTATYNLPRQFSSTQGNNNWYYYEAFGVGSYNQTTWTNCISPWGCGTAYKWGGGNSYFEIDGRDPLNWLLPGASAHFVQTGEGSDAAIGWQAPQAGMIRIAAMLNTAAPEPLAGADCWSGTGCPTDDGVWLSIWKGGTLLAPEQRAFHGKGGDPRVPAALISTGAPVAAGDIIYFYVRRGNWQDSDGAFYSFTVSYDPAADLDYPVSSHTASGNMLALSATDNGGSGVALIEYAQYSPAGDGWHTYSGPITFLQPGAYQLMYRAIDQVGNTEPYHTVSLTVSSAATCVTPPSGLVGWWPGETDGRDLTGANPATLQGNVTFVPAMVGQGFSLDGSSYVEVPDSPSLRPASLTIDGWFKFNSVPSGLAVLVGKTVGTANDDSFVIWYQDGALRACVGTTADCPQIAFTLTPAAGDWYHVAFTFDQTSQAMALYVNGVRQASGTSTAGAIQYDSHPLLIGAEWENEALANWFPGLIDEVEIYSRALTAGEIASLYNAGALGKCLVPLPTLASISPLTAVAGTTGLTLAVTGSNFVPGSVVRWNDQDRTTTFVDGAHLSAAITTDDLALAGTALVTVFNPAPGGGTSNAITLTIVAPNPLPVVTSISPVERTAGSGGFLLTVSGLNFISGSTVQWAGSARSTTYGSGTQLTTQISDADVATAGLFLVTAVNPAPGGGASAGMPFTVHPAGSYLVGDAAPAGGNDSGLFGDDSLDNPDLILALRAVTSVPGFTPPNCSDLFDAMDSYPTDTEVRGGDGMLDNLDLIATLRRVTHADAPPWPRRPTRGLVCSTMAPGLLAMLARPVEPPSGAGAVEFQREQSGEDGAARVAVYLAAYRDVDLGGLSLALGWTDSSLAAQAPLRFVSAAAGAPALLDNRLPGTIAAAWLGGLRLRAGQRLLLGFVDLPAAGGQVSFPVLHGVKANDRTTGRQVPIGVSRSGGTTQSPMPR
jgi:uncharacterized repeat protein (TIGR01451 family)